MPRPEHVAVREVGTVLAEAVVGRRGQLPPQGGILGQVHQLREVPAAGGPGPLTHPGQGRQLAAAGPHRGEVPPLQAIEAEVVLPPLQQGHARGGAEGAPHQGDVPVKELLLQVPGRRREHDPPPAEKRRDEIGEGLARAGARLADEGPPRLDRMGHGARHLDLFGAHGEAGNEPRQRPSRAELLGHQSLELVPHRRGP